MVRVTVATALVVSVLTWLAATPSAALSIQPFTIAFQTNTNGAIGLLGNNLETCLATDPACAAGRTGAGPKINNNDFNMAFLNADPAVAGNPGFFSSSGASFTLPPGGQVLYAQLSWGARVVAGTSGLNAVGPTNQMRFKLPGAAGYQTITATSLFSSGNAVQSGMYHAFTDVTSLVKANPGGVTGQYWGANVAAATGVDRYAGWSLTMVYSDPAQPLRNLTVYNGFTVVQSGDPAQNVTVSGFLAPKFGPVNASVGVVAYEGDLGITGDQMQMNGVPLSDAVVPSNNFFNSGNSAAGVLNTARTPADADMLGFDVKTVAANGVVANGATSATITLTTSGDSYSSGVITSSINLNSPQFNPQSKFVTNVTGSSSRATVGDTLEYLIDYPNTGADGAANSIMTDPLPAGLTYVPGSLQYAVGTVSGGMGPFAPLSDRPGDDNGEFNAPANTVTVRMGVGANATTGGLIRPGDRVQAKFRVVVGPSLAGTTVANTDVLDYTLATLGSPVHRPGLPATIPVAPQADLAITKTATPSPLTAGQAVSYLITVTNNGPNDAANVAVVDNLSANLTFGAATPSQGGPCTVSAGLLTCPLGTVANGASATIGVTSTLPPGATGFSSVTNGATVSSSTDDPNAANNSTTVVTPVLVSADVAAGITVTSPAGPVTPGSPVQLTLTATNNGPSTATGVILSEDLSPLQAGSVVAGPGCSITGAVLTCVVGTLAPGASFRAVVQATVSPDATAGTISASDSVSSTSPDPNPANDTASTTIPVGPAAADLSVTKVPNPAGPAVAGTAQGWSLTVTNNGPSTAQSVTVSDPAPAGYLPVSASPNRGTCSIVASALSCSFGSLNPGGVATVALTGTVDDSFTGLLSNAATASSPTPDPVPANNTGTGTVQVNASADLAVTKTATPAVPGTNITFTLSTTNNGPSTARSAQVSDPLPAGFTFVSVAGAAGCTTPPVGANGTVTCPLGDILNDNSTHSITVVALIPATFTGSVTNTATVSSATPDPQSANNTASFVVSGAPTADLSLQKTVDTNPLIAGGPVTYTVTVTNNGPSAAAQVAMTDTLPADSGGVAQLTNVAVTPPAGLGFTCSVTPNPANPTGVGCSQGASGTLPSGATAVFTVTATLLPNLTLSTIINSASVTSATPDPTTSNNSDRVVSDVVEEADLSAAKTPSATTVASGGQVTYTLSVTNAGPSAAGQASFVDVLPDGESFVSASIPPGVICTLVGQVVTCTTTAPLQPGATVSGTITLQASPSLPAGTALSNTATVSSQTADPNPANNAASSTVTTTTSADIAVTKVVTPNPVVAGATATYTLTVVDNGPSDAQDVTATDTLPAGLNVIDASPSQGTCAITGQTVTCPIGTVPAGATVTVTISVTTPSSATGSITNTATAASATTPDPVPANNTATTTSAVIAQADLRMIKTASAPTVDAGSALSYTLTVSNNGPSDATAVTVTDALPPGFTFDPTDSSPGCSFAVPTLTCAQASLPAGQAVSFVVNVKLAQTLAPGTVTNTASVTSATPDPNPANNAASVPVSVTTTADLALFKSADVTIPSAGTSYTYTLQASNLGPSTAPSISVTDVLPAGLSFVSSANGCTAVGQTVTCTGGALTAGGVTNFQFVTQVAPGTPAGELSNSATVNSPAADPNPANNTSTNTVTVQRTSDLAIVKTETSGPVVAGQPVTYALTATNNGPSDADNAVITDTAPTGTTWASATIPGGTCAITGGDISCTVATLPVGQTVAATVVLDTPSSLSGTLTNTADVTSDSFNPGVDHPSTITNPVATSADLSLTKTVSNPTPNVGDTIAYTVTLANNGPSDATGVTVTDPLPTGLSFVSATPSQGSYDPATGLWAAGTVTAASAQSLTIQAQVVSPDPQTNTASISHADQSDPNPGNDTAAATETPQEADLVLLKTVSDPTPNVGDTITYTVTVIDNGPSAATGVTVTDLLPAAVGFVSATPSQGSYDPATGIWALGTVGTTAAQTLTVSVQVSSPNPEANTATITHADQFDPNPANNTNTASVNPQHADLALLKTVSNPTPNVGDTITYTVTLVNNGPSDATTVTVTDPLPAGLSLGSATPTQGTYDPATGIWALGTVTTTAPPTLTIQARVVSPDPQTNTASLNHADQFDPNPGNNTASATETPQQADLAVTKTVSHPAPNVGDTITYTMSVNDRGPSDSTGVTVNDLLPAGLSFVSATPSQGAYDPATGVWTIGTVTTATAQTLTIEARVVSPNPQTNTAFISHADQFDPDPTNNTTAPVTETPQQADLAVTKTISDPTPNVGDTITYTVTVTDNGPDTATGVTVTDLLPGGLSLTAATPSQGIYNTATGVWNLGTVNTAAPQTLTVQAVVISADPQTNTASISHADQFDPDPTNNTTVAVTETPQQADLAVAKTVSNPTPNVGDTITYTITITDTGPDAATGVTVAEPIPGGLTFVSATPAQGSYDPTTGLWTVGTVTAGPAVTLTIEATVIAADPRTNTATIAHTDQFDPAPINNTASATETPLQADLAVQLVRSNPAASLTPGQPATYTATVANNGPDTAQQVIVSIPLPSGLTFTSATGPGWTCSDPDPPITITCTSPAGPANTTLSPITLVTQVTGTAYPTVTVTATVTSSTFDPNPTNNTATATAPVNAQADLSITKTHLGPLLAGSDATYTLAVTNNGPTPDPGPVTVTDPLPAGLTFVSATGQDWTCAATGSTVTCTLPGPLTNGATTSISLVAVIGAAAAPTAANTATVASANGNDPTPSNNTSTDSATVTPVANLKLAKTLNGTSLQSGQQATYSLAVTDQGPSDAAGPVTVIDHLPAGLTYISATGDAWTCTNANQTVTCAHPGPITASATATVTLAVLVAATSGTVTNTAIASGPTTQTDPSGDSAAITSPVTSASVIAESATSSPIDQTGGTTTTPDSGATGVLAVTGGSPASILRLVGILEAAGIVLVLTSTLGRRRRRTTVRREQGRTESFQ